MRTVIYTLAVSQPSGRVRYPDGEFEMHWKRGHCEILPDGRRGLRAEITEICQPSVPRVVMSGASAACIIIYCTWTRARAR